jgi:LAO/AO transport system kinase
LADCNVLVLMPGQGDEIQSLKAGVMEIGDIFVLNKSDYDGAAHYEQQIRATLELAPDRDGWKPPLVCTVATENKGIEDLKRNINIFRERLSDAPGRQLREIGRWKERILRALQARLMERAMHVIGANELDALAVEIAARKKDPSSAINDIVERMFPSTDT